MLKATDNGDSHAGDNGDGTFGPYNRLRCVCCHAPTLELPMVLKPHLEAASWPQTCLLCQWESPDPRRDYPEVTAGEQDGLTLEAARANVQRFGWIYAPEALPEWMVSGPSTAETRARRALAASYQAIERDRQGLQASELWADVLAAEATLRGLIADREALADDTDVHSADGEEFTW